MSPAGTEIQWQGTGVAAVAAVTEEIARDAVRAIKVDYEVLPHLVKEEDLAKAGARAKAAGESHRRSGQGLPASRSGFRRPLRHPRDHPLLPGNARPDRPVAGRQRHGLALHPGRHPLGGDLGSNLKVPAANIKVKMDYIGGGFGSKFAPDAWGEVAARSRRKPAARR